MKRLFHILRSIYKFFAYCLFFLAVVYVGLATYGYFTIPYLCVELPNGLLIAPAPNQRPHSFRGRNIHILKLPDGSVVVPVPSFYLRITQTTIYGTAGPTPSEEKLYKFAYRPDTGLVLEKHDRRKHSRLIGEAGPYIWGTKDHLGSSSASVYSDKIRDPITFRDDCPVNKFE